MTDTTETASGMHYTVDTDGQPQIAPDRPAVPDALLPWEPPTGTTVLVKGDEEAGGVFTRDDRDVETPDRHWYPAGDRTAWTWAEVAATGYTDPILLVPASTVADVLQLLASDVSLSGVPGVDSAGHAEAVVNWLLEQAKAAPLLLARTAAAVEEVSR